MEIRNNFSIPILKKNTAFKGDVFDFKTGLKVNEKDEQPYITPEYYQSMYGIKKPSYTTTVFLKNGEHELLEIDYDTITELLSDDKGTPNAKLVKKFISLYGETLQKMTDRNDKEVQAYKDILEEQPDVIEIDTPFERLENALLHELTQEPTEDAFNFVQNILSQISGRDKKGITIKLLEGAETEKDYIPSDAFRRTITLFKLSKTAKGYDFSDMEKKNNFANAIDAIIVNFGIEDEDGLYNQFTNNAKDRNGNINWDYATDTTKVVRSLSFFEPLDYVFNQINHFCSKDKKNKDAILNTMIKINKNTNYGMDANSTDFETVMELCFDKNNKFSPERADLLFEKFNEADKWIDSQINPNSDDFERYKTILSYSANMLAAYFNAITDKKGNPDGSKMSFSDFVNSSNISFF